MAIELQIYYPLGPVDVISRTDVVRWVNGILKTHLSKPGELAGGWAYCQLADLLFPDSIDLKEINWQPDSLEDKVINWKLLKSTWLKLKIKKKINIKSLMRADDNAHVALLQWFKKFYHVNFNCRDWDPVAAREEKPPLPTVASVAKAVASNGNKEDLNFRRTEQELEELSPSANGKLENAASKLSTVNSNLMEIYTPEKFVEKAYFYLNQQPPDFIQSAEKAWMGVAHAIKHLFARCGSGIDIRSYWGLNIFANIAINHATTRESERARLRTNGWNRAQRLHRESYSSNYYSFNEYNDILADLDHFVDAMKKVDRKNLWEALRRKFIDQNDDGVILQKQTNRILIGGQEITVGYVAICYARKNHQGICYLFCP